MRAVIALLPVLTLAACGASDTATGSVSMRERLASETHLYVTSSDSAGAVTAQLRSNTGWDGGLVELELESGELVASAKRGGTIALSSLTLELQTIHIPAVLTGHAAELTRPKLQLSAPAELIATWTGDDNAEADATLELELSWTLSVDGVGLPLGAPSLPPLPVKLQLSGDGARITAELRVHAAGELWSWADLLEFTDLELVLGASTPSP